MKKPNLDEVTLTGEQRDALVKRLEDDQLSAEDRQLLAKVIPLFFWLTLTLRETKLSMKRLKVALFGSGPRKTPKKPPDDDPDSGGSGASSNQTLPSDAAPVSDSSTSDTKKPAGHGRHSADVYTGAETVSCRHETLAVGDRCPLCGRGTLYALDNAVTIRIDSHALLNAVRYEVERLRCSACTGVMSAPLPAGIGTDKYTHRAKVALALSRYFLGVPFYRLQHLQTLLGVPVADATQWDQVEQVADAARPVFNQIQYLAAQSGLIYHDDTGVRVLSMIKQNRSDTPPDRVAQYTSGLVACDNEHTIVLYFNGRAHAGENLAAVLAHREAHHPLPLVMSDALAANQAGGLPAHIRCHCLSHALRKFTEIAEHFPEPCQRVIDAVKAVYAIDTQARQDQLDLTQRLAHHQRRSEPILEQLHAWLERQHADNQVEPNSSLGKAMAYLRNHWIALTQFIRVAGAPLDSNTVERALKLMIRQRKNSLFFASQHSAYVAGLLASLIATCAEAGVNAMDYLVALLDNRASVCADPARWLPWNYQVA